jgi:hypothetical protein
MMTAALPPALAMLDPDTERAIYILYRDYFRAAEDDRRWNVWTEVDWEASTPTPSDALLQSTWTVYKEAAYLPDYTNAALKVLRSSRGRTWFVTRWSYEESKRLIGLTEWFQKAVGIPDADLRDATEDLLMAQRHAPFEAEPLFVLADMLLWERHQIAQTEALEAQAQAEGQVALATLCTYLRQDDTAQQAFLAATLRLIRATYPDAVRDALQRVSEAHESPEALRWLREQVG